MWIKVKEDSIGIYVRVGGAIFRPNSRRPPTEFKADDLVTCIAPTGSMARVTHRHNRNQWEFWEYWKVWYWHPVEGGYGRKAFRARESDRMRYPITHSESEVDFQKKVRKEQERLDKLNP